MALPAEAKTRSTFLKLSLVVFETCNSVPLKLCNSPAERWEANKASFFTGKDLSSSKDNISLPTAPLDPRIATVRGLFGRRKCEFKLDEED